MTRWPTDDRTDSKDPTTNRPPLTLPGWVPPAGQLNDLADASITRQRVAAPNVPLPVVYGRDKLSGRIAVVHVDDGAGFLYLAIAFCTPSTAIDKLFVDGIDVNDATDGLIANGGEVELFPQGGTSTLLSTAITGYSDTPLACYAVVKIPREYSRSFPRVDAIIRGKVVYDPRVPATAYSDNPVLAAADVANGAGWPVNWASVEVAANFNDTLIQNEKSRIIGLTLASPRAPEEWMQAFRVYTGCFLYWENGQLFFAPDKAENVPTDLAANITADDIVDGSITLRRSSPMDAPTVCVVDMVDAVDDNEWRAQRAVYSFDELPARVSRISLPGIHRYSQGFREAKERIKRLQNDLLVDLTVFDEGLNLQAGSIVAVTHPIGLNGYFRVLSLSNSLGRWRLVLNPYSSDLYALDKPPSPGGYASSFGSFDSPSPSTAASAVVGYLTNEAHVVAADSLGDNYNLSTAGGEFKVYFGTFDATNSASYTGTTTKNGLTLTIGATTGVYTLSGAAWTTDNETFTLTATYSGVTITQTYSISKSKSGTGADSKSLSISATSQSFKYNFDETVFEPSFITFTANRQNSAATVSWVTQYWHSGSSTWVNTSVNRVSPTTGLSVSLTEAAFRAEGVETLRVIASFSDGGTFTDAVSVVKLKDGAQGPQGTPGTPGAPGYNTATLVAYKRAVIAPVDTPGTLTYTFSTTSWTPANDWSISVPQGADPVWAVAATAVSQTNTDTIESTDWSAPVKVFQDGTSGTGLNVAVVYAYRRTDTDVAPPKPSTTATFTFSNGSLTGLNNSWSATLPVATPGFPYLWVITATASNTTATDSILSSEWADPQKLAQDGIDADPVTLYYIKPTTGTAIKNHQGTLTVEARRVTGGADTLLSTGTIQLYVGSTLVNTANGYATGSNGYTGVFDSGDINDSVTVTLKDGAGGIPLDTITLVDIADGGEGVYGYIEPDGPLAWTRAADQTTWSPSGSTTGLHCTFIQGGVAVARRAWQVTRSAAGILTGTTLTHKDGDWNTARVQVFEINENTQAFTVKFVYSHEGYSFIATETVITSVSGPPGNDAVTGYIEPDGPLSWNRGPDQVTWSPTATTVDLDAFFVKAGTAVARVAQRITRDANGLLTSATTPHKGVDLNPARVTVTVTDSGTKAITVRFAYVFDVDNAQAVQVVTTTLSGSSGDPGDPGTPGANTATVFLYQRTISFSAPSSPSGSSTYTFATGGLTFPSGGSDGWTNTIPAFTGTNQYLWVTTAVATSVNATVSIPAGNWSLVRLLAQNGDGEAAVQLSLSRPSVVLWAYANGNIVSYADAVGQAKVFLGASEVTNDCTFSAVASSGSSGTINNVAGAQPKGYYQVTNLTNATNQATLTITAIYAGVAYVQTFSVAKATGGYEIVATLPVTDLFEGRIVFLTTDDKLYRYTGSAWVKHVDTADLLGTISSGQIADNAISVAKFAAGITPVEIVGSLPASGNYDGRTVFLTTDKKIYRYSVTAAAFIKNVDGSDITANSITAGQIQAGAIGAEQIAAQAITASKLSIVTRGGALNRDPQPTDRNAWYSSPVFGSTTLASTDYTIATVTDSPPEGPTVLRLTSSVRRDIFSEDIAIDPTKSYRLSCWLRKTAGAPTIYLTAAFSDAAGAITAAGATGWASTGSYNYWGLANGLIPTTWTKYSFTFGPAGKAQGTYPTTLPRTVRIGALNNYNVSAGSVIEIQALRIEEMSGATLIENGAITTNKIAALAITADQIDANAVTANKILAGAVTAGKINVTDLSSIKADLGAITAGTVTLNSAGHIKSGQTAYNTGSGFWLGADVGVSKLSIGNPATGRYVRWDGTVLDVSKIQVSAGYLTNTLLGPSSARIATSDAGHSAPIQGYDLTGIIDSANWSADRTLTLGPFLAPDYGSGYDRKRLAFRKVDVTWQFNVSGRNGGDYITVQIRYMVEGVWGSWTNVSPVFNPDLDSRGSAHGMGRVTTNDASAWQQFEIRMISTNNRVMHCAFRVDFINTESSSNAAGSTSTHHTTAVSVGSVLGATPIPPVWNYESGWIKDPYLVEP